MANIKNITGLNTAGGTNVLLAAYGNDVINVDTGLGYGLNLVGSAPEMAVMLDYVFLQDYTIRPQTFNGTTWGYTNVRRAPFSKYLYPFNERMYYFNCKIPDINLLFESRVFYSDLPKNNEIQMGLEWGTNGATFQDTYRFVSANAGFKKYGVKVGDPLFIVSGNQQGEYTISSIISDREVRLVEKLAQTETSLQFWCGRNWFDVRTNNNDVGMWITENNDRLLLFKQDSLHRRGDPGSPLQRIKGTPGTSSGRSVKNVGKELTIYFHGSTADKTGFYAYNGVEGVRISNGVQPFIDGIASSFYGSVIAWEEGNLYRAYIGDLSNSQSSNKAFNISMSKAVFTYDTVSGAVSIDPINDVVTASGSFRESGKKKIFLGNDSGQILETPSGNAFGTANIPFVLELYPIYPRGTDILNMMARVQVIGRDCVNVHVLYKLWDNPYDIDQNWQSLGDLKADKTELVVPLDHARASGIQLRFEEISTKENTCVIEKITVFSYPLDTVIAEIQGQH